jgi:hypothetical protein
MSKFLASFLLLTAMVSWPSRGHPPSQAARKYDDRTRGPQAHLGTEHPLAGMHAPGGKCGDALQEEYSPN